MVDALNYVLFRTHTFSFIAMNRLLYLSKTPNFNGKEGERERESWNIYWYMPNGCMYRAPVKHSMCSMWLIRKCLPLRLEQTGWRECAFVCAVSRLNLIFYFMTATTIWFIWVFSSYMMNAKARLLLLLLCCFNLFHWTCCWRKFNNYFAILSATQTHTRTHILSSNIEY